MVRFQKIRFKNFLSSGGQFTEIELQKSRTTLIVGENGAGKSTMLDALCFALYGKAFRNINKPQLISSINQKDCLVEVEFTIGKKKYLVARGIKPTIFDIYVDGQLIDQSAASRDYQSFFEEQILKINYRSFTQIVILGTASFTPFMQLPAAHRREIIEDILDIKIFSQMNVILKDKMAHLKDKIVAFDSKITVQKEKTLLQKSFLKTLEDKQKKQEDDIQTKIDQMQGEIAESILTIKSLEEKIEGLEKQIDPDKTSEEINNLASTIKVLEKRNKKHEDDIKQMHSSHGICPTCSQAIDSSKHEKHIEQHNESIRKNEKQINEAIAKLDSLKKTQNMENEIAKSITRLESQVAQLKSSNNTSMKYIRELKVDLESNVKDYDIQSEKKKLKEMAQMVVSLSNRKSLLNEEKQYQDICAVLLKDTGIKTTVIRQYLPVINKFVNKFLSIMDFFVHFELDEAFNETIKSRHRDDFSYASFSEGEKQRINLALLFTWRTVAKMKNSVNTNLLILDEVFDSSLDANGTEYVMQLLNALGENTNIFVISHKSDQLVDKFDTVIRFEKHNNFSKITA
jgi:DNA repair exonuclease SbcCD ATPase subunit